MNDNPVAIRRLNLRYESGEIKEFSTYIFMPFTIDNEYYCCEIYSDEVCFRGRKKLYGVDAIDSIDYAIQLLDTLLSEFSGGKILWPDGSPYVRVPTTRKMGWPDNQVQ